jgi:HPt (histidine-containing phosphotransfer) domain-containing protein
MQPQSLIDHAHLDAQTFGDADLAREVLQLFVTQCTALLPAIGDATLGMDARADHAHTLRGSAVGVGARAVAAACAMLEGDFRAGTLEPDGLGRLAAAVAATLDEIADGGG